MTAWLRENGHPVNCKRVRQLLRLMGLEVIYPKPRLSLASPGHQIYPYLLRGVKVMRANQVWSADITYVRLLGGFVYLVAVIDWYSRYVLSWEVRGDDGERVLCERVESIAASGKAGDL